MPIYLDNAASSVLSSQAEEALLYALKINGNASSIHSSGRESRKIVEQSREIISGILNTTPSEIIFTSTGTESDNLAVKGLFLSSIKINPEKRRILVGAGEHHAVLDPVLWLEKYHGAIIEYIDLLADGRVDISDLKVKFNRNPNDVALIAVILVNNETGSITDVKEISELIKPHEVPLHVDAVSACGHIKVDFQELGASTLAFSGHKFNGPQGVAGLIVSRNSNIEALNHGGGHERNLRSGTYATALIYAMSAALENSIKELENNNEILWDYRKQLIESISEIPFIAINGVSAQEFDEFQYPGILNITFKGCEGDALLMLLDAQGIECSTGAACSAGVSGASHVLQAMGLSTADARGSLRLSFDTYLTQEDIKYICKIIPSVVERARMAGMA